jgi:hypothetical protein
MKPGAIENITRRGGYLRGIQMKKLCYLLLLIVATAASAYANNGGKNGKGDNNDKPGSNDRPSVKASTKPTRVEEFVWMLTRESEAPARIDECELQHAVVDLYKWYLQNETKISTNEYLKGGGKELIFPFKVDVKTLQQYFQFIKNNFPGLSEEYLNSESKRPLTHQKKYAPVTERDDMENPMSISVSR